MRLLTTTSILAAALSSLIANAQPALKCQFKTKKTTQLNFGDDSSNANLSQSPRSEASSPRAPANSRHSLERVKSESKLSIEGFYSPGHRRMSIDGRRSLENSGSLSPRSATHIPHEIVFPIHGDVHKHSFVLVGDWVGTFSVSKGLTENVGDQEAGAAAPIAADQMGLVTLTVQHTQGGPGLLEKSRTTPFDIQKDTGVQVSLKFGEDGLFSETLKGGVSIKHTVSKIKVICEKIELAESLEQAQRESDETQESK